MTAFVAVVDLNGFAPAARQLGVSASAITRFVAALEDRLGVALLRRTTRSMTLTDAGARYLERARRILAEVKEAENSAQAERHAPSGRLVISAVLLWLLVTKIDAQWSEALPDPGAHTFAWPTGALNLRNLSSVCATGYVPVPYAPGIAPIDGYWPTM